MVYQKFGSALTVVELTDSLLPGLDRECVKVVERRLKKLGATLKTEARAEGFEKNTDGSIAVRVSAAAPRRRLNATWSSSRWG